MPVEQFTSLCWALRASAQQLSSIASEAALNGKAGCDAARREAYLLMMLGPLSAIEAMRRRLTPV